MVADDPIDLRERFAADIDCPVRREVPLAASAELPREDFLRPPAHAVGRDIGGRSGIHRRPGSTPRTTM